MSTTSVTDAVRWNAEDYAANSGSQLSWARELMSRLALTGDERILDVGCGDGKVTAELARAVPRGEAVGIDSSINMIDFAIRTHQGKTIPNLEFHVMDARSIRFLRRFDIVFSNAALHWVDDHRAFLRGAAEVLRSGGRLMVSCGGKGNAQDLFLALRPEMRAKRWRGCFRGLTAPYFFYGPDRYHEWLAEAGFESAEVKLVPKDALFEGRAGLAAWIRTTWLPYVQRVPEADREKFIDAVASRYLAIHAPDGLGRVPVGMVRLEIEAVKV